LLTNKQILIKSIRLTVILNILNLVLSLALSKVFSGGFEIGQITGIFGNITLLETMALFLYGGAIDFSNSVTWSSITRILRLPFEAKEDNKKPDYSTHDRINEHEIKKDIEKAQIGQKNATVFVLVGAIFLGEIIILAIFSV